jgi:hypothetical protein
MEHGTYDPDNGVWIDAEVNGKAAKGWVFLDGGGSDWDPASDSELVETTAEEWLELCELANGRQAREFDPNPGEEQ